MTASNCLADWPWPAVLAHRCGGALAPENTLCGLDLCLLTGCRGVEFDVMLSGDGSPILIHDDTLDRTTNGAGQVCQTPDTLLALLDAGSRHHPAFAGEAVPFFRAAAARLQALGLAANVEIKPSPGIEALTGEVVARMAAELWRGQPLPPLLSSFSEEALDAAAVVAPELPRGLLVGRVPTDWQARCERVGAIALHANGHHLDEPTARKVREAGYRLAAYTINEPAHAHRLFQWGVDCVITDRPDRIFEPLIEPA